MMQTERAALLWDEIATYRGEAHPDEARLARELHRRDLEFGGLRRIASVVVEELDRTALLHEVVRECAAVMRAEIARVWLTDADGTVLYAVCEHGVACEGDRRRIAPGVGLVGTVLRRREAVMVHDSTDSLLAEEGGHARNALGVPMLDHQRRVVGILEVRDRRDGAVFTTHEAEVLAVLGCQAAVGIVRAEMFDRMNEWGQSLEMLLAFNAAVNRHLEPSQLVRSLVENAARFLKAWGGRAGLLLPAADNDGAEMVADGRCERGQWREEHATWREGVGIPGHLLESEFPYISNDYAADRLHESRLVQAGVARVVAVPIKTAELQIIGFFEMHRQDRDPPFSWQDAAFIESLANTAAVAIQNVQLLKALELSRARIQALSADHVTRLEGERRHIARELHDVAGQALIGIKLRLQALGRRVAEDAALGAELDQLRGAVNDSTLQLKDLARRLRPPTLDALGLVVALRQLTTDVSARTGLRVTARLGRNVPRLSHDAEIAFYRIAQEALTNVARHAEATTARVRLIRRGRAIVLEVGDDGRGFDDADTTPGFGLLGIHERMEMLGGVDRVQSTPGRGTVVRVELPLSRAIVPPNGVEPSAT